MVKNALDNPHTDTGKQITEWSARAKAQTGSEDTCPTTNMDKWDPSKFAGTQECPRIHRAKGEPILDALRRAWGSGRITPAVLTGEWPEFSSLDSVVTTLEQCSVRCLFLFGGPAVPPRPSNNSTLISLNRTLECSEIEKTEKNQQRRSGRSFDSTERWWPRYFRGQCEYICPQC